MSYPGFPRLAPVSRSIVAGDYPTARKRAMNGRTYSLAYGDRKMGDRVSLQFRLTEANTLAILDHYERVEGTYGVFSVLQSSDGSEGVFSGMKFTSGLPTEILSDESSKGKYRYAEPPTVSQVHRNLYDVQVELV